MQLDQTRIVIRERNGLDVLDLAVVLLRVFFRRCFPLFLCGAIPFIAWNLYVTAWMPFRGEEYSSLDVSPSIFRYLWANTLLVFIQAPFACSMVTSFLGRAAFETPPTFRTVRQDVRLSRRNRLLCLGLVRMMIPVSLLALVIDRAQSFHYEVEILLMGGASTVAALIRIGRPFLPEILILERNPLRSSQPDAVTTVRRNRLLHSLNTGELLVRWGAAGIASLAMFGSFYYSFLFVQGVFTNIWAQNSFFMLYVAIPISMWSIAFFVSIVRYLNYLDQRIRYEGWEVELKLRAEGRRLTELPAIE
jgi:hypothetical protein